MAVWIAAIYLGYEGYKLAEKVLSHGTDIFTGKLQLYSCDLGDVAKKERTKCYFDLGLAAATTA